MSEDPTPPAPDDEEPAAPRPKKRTIALAVLITGVVALTAAPTLGGVLTMVALGVGLVLVVVGASLGPRGGR